MPGSDDLLRIIDAPLEVAELEKVKVKLIEMKEEIKNFSGISLFTKSTNGAADFRSQATALTEALARIKSMEEELDKMRSSNATKQKARTDQEIAETQRKTEATRTRVRDIRSEEDAYRQLTNEYKKHADAVKVAAAQYGVHSKEAKAATAALIPFAERLHAVNKAADDGRSFVGRYTQSIKEGFKDIIGQAAQMVGAFYLIQKAFDFIKDSVKDFMNVEAASSRLNNILSNLGREDVLADLNREAKELSESLGTVAQKDVTETFQKLITYGKLTKNQILELTPVIADFAAKQRIDMPEATSAITKALEGNARALKEYGINIKDGKDATERFGIIMTELKPRVDGAAKAFGETLAGGMKKSEIAIEELKVQVGAEFAPAIERAEKAILEGAKGIPMMFESINNGFQNIMEKGKVAFLVLAKIASFGKYTGLDDYIKDKAAQNKILEDSQQLQRAKEEAESFRKEASERTLEAQAHELNVQKELLIGDLARYKLEASKGAVTQATTYELQKQNEIVKALVGQYNSSRDKRILGVGGGGKKDTADTIKEENQKIKRDTLGIGTGLLEARERPENMMDEFEKNHGNFIDNIGSQIDAQAAKDAEAQKKKDDAAKALADHKLRMHDLEMEFGNEALHLSESLVKDGYEREINAIQKKIDLNNELHEKETRSIASSTLSLQEKAEAQILLDAKVSANNEALKRKERDIKVKEAQFDKAAAIAEIIEKTAVAVVSALSIPIYGEAEAIVIGAIGAAQLAAVAAKPVPTYKSGGKHKEDGLMLVHPGEMIVEPSGKISMTPNKPETLMFGKRNTEIIPAHKVNQMRLSTVLNEPSIVNDNADMRGIKEALQEIGFIGSAQLAIMKKKQNNHIHIHWNPGFNDHINNAVKN